MSALSREVPQIVRYADVLNAAWLDHCAPREANAPTVISLFAGGGGSSLGYSMAGYRELLAAEWDDHAVDTFRRNFPNVPVYHGDISQLTVEHALRLANLEPGELSVLDGSPPCQGFSTAGRRDMSDSRNNLFREFVRLLRGLQPRVFVMENVSGLVVGKMKLMLAEIMRELKGSGYVVSARVMNAQYFGVPQSRERIIFIGVRDGLPSHPPAQTRILTLRDALRGVVNSEQDIIESRYKTHTQAHAKLQIMREGERGSKYHPRGLHFGLTRLKWDAPSRTVLRQDGGGQSCQCCHPTELRRLTIPEVKRVCSFPDQFSLHGKVGDRWARLGNSVPPLFMRAIAIHVRTQLLST